MKVLQPFSKEETNVLEGKHTEPRGSSQAVIEYLMGTCLQALRDDNYIQRVMDRSAECPYRYDTHGVHSWRVFLYVAQKWS